MRNALFSALIAILFSLMSVLIIVFGHIVAPINQWVVLVTHYGMNAVRTNGLMILDTHPRLVVSNGDGLSFGITMRYAFLQTALIALSTACCFALLYCLDKRIFSGRVAGFLRDEIRAINETALTGTQEGEKGSERVNRRSKSS